MKLKELAALIGLRPAPKTYGHRIESFELERDGRIEFAQWNHPRSRPAPITQAEVDELRRYLRPGDTAVDIGAHLGDTAVPMALAAGPTGAVLALEPNPYVFRVLEANARLNPDVTNIVPLPFAATPEDGPIEFEYSDSGFCNGGRHESISRWKHAHAFKLEVEGRNLPRLLRAEYPERLARLRLIKIDAEGFDATILESLGELIEQHRPYLRSEVFKHLDGAQRERLWRAIAERDYRVHKLESAEQFQGQRLELADMQRWPHFDVFGVPDGV